MEQREGPENGNTPKYKYLKNVLGYFICRKMLAYESFSPTYGNTRKVNFTLLWIKIYISRRAFDWVTGHSERYNKVGSTFLNCLSIRKQILTCTRLVVWRAAARLQRRPCRLCAVRLTHRLVTRRPHSLIIPGIEASFCWKCCTWWCDICPPFIPLCLSNSIFFSGSVGHVHKWHQDDNYYNYVLIQRRHCGIVSVSFSMHNCGTSDGLIAANATSWAIIHHPPHFFSLPGCSTMMVTFVGVIRLIQLMKRRGNTK